MRKRRVKVDDLMQSNYFYFCTEPAGRNFHPDFQPELTPKEMLELGVFGGKYMKAYFPCRLGLSNSSNRYKGQYKGSQDLHECNRVCYWGSAFAKLRRAREAISGFKINTKSFFVPMVKYRDELNGRNKKSPRCFGLRL